jgi:hypothetical protein
MRTRLLTVAALVSASALTINAQQTRPNQQQPPRTGDTTQRTTAAAADQPITVTGCLTAEQNAAANPNAGARAGATDKFILTSVKMASGSTTSGIGLAPRYQVDGLAAAELQKHLNHQVEITGTLTTGNAMGNRGRAPETNPGAEKRQGTPQSTANADLPQLQATSLKMVSATCPTAL